MPISEIVSTIAQQLKDLNPLSVIEYNIQNFVSMNETTLRLHTRQAGYTVNIDITLNEGLDLYEMRAYKLTNHGLNCVLCSEYLEIFVEELHDNIRRCLNDAQEGKDLLKETDKTIMEYCQKYLKPYQVSGEQNTTTP